MTNNISIKVPVLTRVEGEGALHLDIKDEQVSSLALKIFEPPRLFEKFLEGRDYREVPDFVARICGICPVAYQMSAVNALENLFSFQPDDWIRDMRRVLYFGEWIQSHSLHIHLLAIPDFLGFSNAFEMAEKYPEEVRRGLRIQAIGNEIMRTFGGRSVHPVGVCVGGFHRAPDVREIKSLVQSLESNINEAYSLLEWLLTLDLPKTQSKFTNVSLTHEREYPINEGAITSDSGLKIGAEEYLAHFNEQQVEYSTAFHSLLNGKPYLVGPLARLNLNWQHIPESIRSLVENKNIHFPSDNMFHSLIARAIEIVFAITDAKRILQNYHVPEAASGTINIRNGAGYGCSEAPRGLLWHSYTADEKGIVQSSNIIPPTSQNQARIEKDLYENLNKFIGGKTEDEIRHFSEMIIRNYDPCISCSTHFLKLTVNNAD